MFDALLTKFGVLDLYDEIKTTKRCRKIYDTYLIKLDNTLYRHLAENEIVPEIHLTRWLRCLLTREFSIS